MLTKYALHKLQQFERRFDYDASYMKDILKASPMAFFRLVRLQGISSFREGVPRAPWYVAKLVGALHEDCGPCAQLVVNMAKLDKVAAPLIRAVVAGNEAAMPDEIRLSYRYARAVINREPSAHLIDEINRLWGTLGHVSLAFAVVSGRLYPMLKYALGRGLSCSKLRVEDDTLLVQSGSQFATPSDEEPLHHEVS